MRIASWRAFRAWRFGGMEPSTQQPRTAAIGDRLGLADELDRHWRLAKVDQREGLLSHGMSQQRGPIGLPGCVLGEFVMPPRLADRSDVEGLPADERPGVSHHSSERLANPRLEAVGHQFGNR
jgi:hypothetical protein